MSEEQNIYRLERRDMMGFPIEEKFYKSLDKAKKEYKKRLGQYRRSMTLVKKDDVNHLSKPIVKNDVPHRKNIISEHMIELWYKSSYEYDEWDTTVESLILEKIDVA